MLNPRLATRYAKSILDLAVERNELETVYADMQLLHELMKASPEFAAVLRSPIIAPDKKVKILEAVTASRISPLTTLFIRLLVQKSREASLPEIAPAFLKQYKVRKGIQTVKLTTAAPISEAAKAQIVEQVRRTGNLDLIELQTEVNPDLIGGFVLQAGDKLVDASVAYDLKQIARQFENNDFIYKVR